jgi:hypothetical protein
MLLNYYAQRRLMKYSFTYLFIEMILKVLKFLKLKELNEQSKANIKDKHLANQCFANNYIIGLLKSYGFTSFSNIEFTDTVKIIKSCQILIFSVQLMF